jgi:acyl-CoA dehydrogenase
VKELRVRFELSSEQRLIVDTVRGFVEAELYPHEDEVERLDAVPAELAAEIRGKAIASGLYAANMPAELGGGGLDAVGLTLAERELGRASYALQMLVARPSNILRACAGDQVETYLLPSIRGERHDCLAMTEPGAGSDVRSMRTRAVRTGDHYVVNGTKHFISHADLADFVILFAATGPPGDGRTAAGGAASTGTGISAFLVDTGTPGLEVRRGSGCVSHRGYHQCELIFSDCRIPAGQRLGAEGQGLALMGEWLGASRLSVAATSVGRARRVLEMAIHWAATREQFGRPVGRFQGTGFKLADMATELEAAELLTLRAAWRLDRGRMTDQDAAMAKLFASEALGRITDQAVQIFGGMGLMDELPIERFWRDARVERIWDGTSEIQRHIISRALLRPYSARPQHARPQHARPQHA